MHRYTVTHRDTESHTETHTDTCTDTHIHMHTYTHSYKDRYTSHIPHKHTETQTHAHTHTEIDCHTHTHTHTFPGSTQQSFCPHSAQGYTALFRFTLMQLKSQLLPNAFLTSLLHQQNIKEKNVEN